MSTNHHFENSGNQLRKTDLKNFELNTGFSLPDDYKRFLQKTNGGAPVPPWFVWPDRKPTEIGELYLYSIDRNSIGVPSAEADPYSIEHAIFRFSGKNVVPEGFLCIGFKDGDQPILLCCTGARIGSVYVKLVGEAIASGDSPRDNLFRIAPSFGELLNLLTDYEAIPIRIRDKYEQ